MSGWLHVNADGSVTVVDESGVRTGTPKPIPADVAKWIGATPATITLDFTNDETPGPIPQGDQAGGASAPRGGEARS